MANVLTALFSPKGLEDPFKFLPLSHVTEYEKGDVIYTTDRPPESLYLVLAGKVKVSWRSYDGWQTIVDIYKSEEFFGQSALVGLSPRGEAAEAMEKTKLMAWSVAQVEAAITKHSQLGVALLQIMVQRTVDLTVRLNSFCSDSIPTRLAQALLGFSERFGAGREDGGIRMMPLTHQLIAEYVGTSREMVSQHMNRFRRQGYIRYSRWKIIVYRDPLREFIGRRSGLSRALPRRAQPPPESEQFGTEFRFMAR